MPSIEYEGQSYAVLDGESVLDALLRNGVPAAHSCKAGSCGSCLMRAIDGTVPARSQQSLKDSWKAQGYFLACVCKPENDLRLSLAGQDARLAATISGLTLLSSDVMQVRVRCEDSLTFRPGQYVTLVRTDGLSRTYSIASLPDDGELHFHVRRITSGRMSEWLHTGATVGDRISLVGPSGECFYVPGTEDQPILLAGTGTGLAPLYGILRDALRHNHRAPVRLFHGALHTGGLYLVDQLRSLAQKYPQFEYTPAVLKGAPSDGVELGPIDQVIAKHVPKLAGWRGFVCGDPALVQMLKKKLFLAGMASREIYADSFTPAAS